MVDIFDEVSEDLRNERALTLAKRYGGLLLIAMLLVLAGIGAQQYYTSYQAKQADKAAARYLAITGALDAPGARPAAAQLTQAAQALTSFAATAPEGYKTLANLRAAGLYAAGGQAAQAAALWNGITADDHADKLLRDLATLLWAQHALGTTPDADVLAKLQPLTQSTNPYHALARETQALTYLHEGNTGMAKALFSQIANDPNAPDGVRNRAGGLLAKING
ncbi:MAG: tetratricopeptide repeat protein [Acidocella sp.]|nr:tetratricopeptide repeat protein [Acidocella sp.]